MAQPPTSIAAPAGGLDVACDLCGTTAAKTVLRTPDVRYGLGGDFALARCTACGLQRTLPQPADPGAYYPADEYYIYQPPAAPAANAIARVRRAYGQDAGDAGSLRARLAARVTVDRLSPGLPPGPPGDMLDVGCGSGDFLLLLAAAGWRPHGVEPDAQAVAAAHAAGLTGVRHGDLTELDVADASFDAVRFWHSLEHVRSPRAQLTAARRVVREGGSLTIGVPNVGSLLSRTARKRWYYLDMPRHLWHFDRRRLSALVEECGFRVQRARLVSTGSAVLGTAGYLTGKGERVLESRPAWYAALAPAMALDAVGLGDAIHLTARAV